MEILSYDSIRRQPYMCKFILETQKLLTADYMFQTKQKPHQTLQFIGAETVIISISMRPASQKPVAELIPIGIS